jgi:hypothetical protein
VLVTVPVLPKVVAPLMLRLFRPVTVSAAPVPSTASPVMLKELPAPTTTPWVVMVLPVKVVSLPSVTAPA